ncbi:hypothetical protein ACIBI9_56185 [Nonomuraea sp. NPDC050451]|uniref:hypothetical protein n=1 Tax=Nonomuraea sp. NPDC050451 TaxID=3364364 RepID=UPI00378897BD
MGYVTHDRYQRLVIEGRRLGEQQTQFTLGDLALELQSFHQGTRDDWPPYGTTTTP